jgi:hypothetical protein
MKKLLIILIVSAVSLGASAQHGYTRHGGGGYRRSHVVVSVGAPIYPYYGYGYYDPFYSPFNRYGYAPRETRLERKISDIRNDYRDKIWSARHDKSLRGSEKRETIHRLKQERDQAINDTKRNYYKSH